ncbi:MAG TPA: hypothetical protein VNZ44_01995, partial [Pyrinomonadaceae bacterium]|nr:hypothetical protein [Pyrinomonadaceae bacterium]
MHKRARSWSSWLGVAVLLAGLAAGAFAFASASGGAGDVESLKNDVSELKSRAGVGRLLAEQALAGNVTDTFVRAQSEQIRKGVEDTRAKLEPKQFEQSLATRVLKASDAALRLEGALRALRDGGAARESAESAERSLAALQAELSEMEDGLK